MTVVTRFAPSPTGLLHLGHVANAVWTWGSSRALGGTVLLRLEDHDRGRCRPEYEAQLLDDLAWLGFHPDNGPLEGFRARPHPFRQSDAEEIYREALGRLTAKGLVYGCRCTRKTIAEAAVAPAIGGEEVVYPGTCGDLGLPPEPPFVARIRLPDEPVEFTDRRLGLQRQAPRTQCGDLLARDARGWWSYQFAVTVDDVCQGVTFVVRGEDILPSTGRQILLARLLGRSDQPVWLHHPLIRSPEGVKLSKRDGSTGLRELRAEGAAPAEVIGLAAHRTGLIDVLRPVEAAEVATLF